jgi:hypothetical protein
MALDLKNEPTTGYWLVSMLYYFHLYGSIEYGSHIITIVSPGKL